MVTPAVQSPLRCTSPCFSQRSSDPIPSVQRPEHNDPVNAISALWDQLAKTARSREREQAKPIYFNHTDVMTNATKVACLNNDHVLRINIDRDGRNTKPIHAHRIMSTSAGSNDSIESIQRSSYAAGQSPPPESYEDFLLHGLASGHGIYQFVSRKTHQQIGQSDTASIIDMLNTRIANQPGHTPLVLGGRYRVVDFTPVVAPGSDIGKSDFARYALNVVEIGGDTPSKMFTVPVTQAGLQFTGGVLRSRDIARASVILNEHEKTLLHLRNQGEANCEMDRIVLSKAGFGRNATLITYQKICVRIDQGTVNADSLIDALREEIELGRQQRDPNYVHSRQQLVELHAALQEKIRLMALVARPPENLNLVDLPQQGTSQVSGSESPIRRRLQDEAGGVGGLGSQTPPSARPILPTMPQPAAPNAFVPSNPQRDSSSSSLDSRLSRNDVTGLSAAPADRQVASVTNAAPSRSKLGSRWRDSRTLMNTLGRSVMTSIGRLLPENRDGSKYRPPNEPGRGSVSLNNNPMAASSHRRPPLAALKIPPRKVDQLGGSDIDASSSDDSPVVRVQVDLDNLATFPPQEIFGTKIHTFGATTIDVDYLSSMLNRTTVGGTHRVKTISGAKSDCWWRAAWTTALLRHAYSGRKTDFLEKMLIKKLGADCNDDAKHITTMITAIRERGFAAVLTRTTSANLNADLEATSKLKLPVPSDEQDKPLGEDICRRLTDQLLCSAGVRDLDRMQSVHGNDMGEAPMTAALCNALGCDLVILSLPWRKDRIKEWDKENSSITVSAQPESELRYMQINGQNRKSLAEEMVKALESTPVLIHHGAHYNLSIPSGCIAAANYPT